MLETTNHLKGKHADCFNLVLATAHIEQVLEIWAQQVNDEDIVKTLLTEVMNLRDALYWDERRQRERGTKEQSGTGTTRGWGASDKKRGKLTDVTQRPITPILVSKLRRITFARFLQSKYE